MAFKLFNRDKPATDPAQDESFVSHLVELRDRMIRSLVVVLLLFGVCFYFSPDIMKFLSQPLYEALPAGSRPIFTDQAGAFFTLTKVAFLSALLASLPWVLYQAWAFVAPGLYEHEKRFAMPLIVSVGAVESVIDCPLVGVKPVQKGIVSRPSTVLAPPFAPLTTSRLNCTNVPLPPKADQVFVDEQ